MNALHTKCTLVNALTPKWIYKKNFSADFKKFLYLIYVIWQLEFVQFCSCAFGQCLAVYFMYYNLSILKVFFFYLHVYLLHLLLVKSNRSFVESLKLFLFFQRLVGHGFIKHILRYSLFLREDNDQWHVYSFTSAFFIISIITHLLFHM